MRTIMALGTAALLTLVIIVSWVSQTAPSTEQAKAHTASAKFIDPFELMKQSNDLPHQQYDAY